MDFGKLNKRLTIQQRAPGQDASGQPTLNWVDVVTVWAGIRPLSSRELIAAQASQSEISHEITIRYRSDVTAAMRGVYKGRYFNFGMPRNMDESNRELVIPATEGLNKG